MKVCKNCAAQLPDEAVFCTQCKIPYEQSTQNDFDLERTNLLSDEVESISTNEQSPKGGCFCQHCSAQPLTSCISIPAAAVGVPARSAETVSGSIPLISTIKSTEILRISVLFCTIYRAFEKCKSTIRNLFVTPVLLCTVSIFTEAASCHGYNLVLLYLHICRA